MMATISPAADREIARLLEENRYLNQDLKQLQTDKDFVWSLWKKLQVSNPDVTQAVGLVVQRERERAEIRDRKVLEILQKKDEKLQELQTNLSYKTRELGESTVKHSDVNEEIIFLQREVATLHDRNSTLELQLKKRSTSPGKACTNTEPTANTSRSRTLSPAKTSTKADSSKSVKPKTNRNIEGREKNLEKAHSDTIRNYEQEKRELSQKLHKVTMELETARSGKADEMAGRVQLESKVRTLDREIEQKLGKFEELVRELEEARTLLRRFESQARKQQEDLEFKNQELETVRKELAEIWSTHNQLTEHSSQQADLIRQIQSLQTDTQKMMKNQEDAYSLESNSIQQMYTELTSRYDMAKKAESELRSQVLALKKAILDKDDIISEMQHKLDKQKRRTVDNSGSFLHDDQVAPVLDLEYKVKSMQREIDNLRRQLVEKEGFIEQLEDDAINETIEFDVARLNRHERTHSTPSRQFRSIALSPMKGQEEKIERVQKSQRSRSMSPSKDRQRPRYHVQKDLEDCKAILKLKIRELNELKRAHQKRQERLKTVQDNYKNVKEQLKTLEAEYYGSKKKTRKLKRADPKELRHEDSAAVWNELAYFKNENRTMAVERMAIEEELDNLRVQSSEDAATIHELKVAIEQERDERAYDKKKVERNLEGASTQKSEIVLLKSEVQNKDVIVQRLERDIGDLRCDRDSILEEKKVLKQEMLDMKQEASQHRMDQADLRRNINRLKRELEEEKAISKLNANKAAATAATAALTQKTVVKPASKTHRRRNRNNFNVSASKKFNELIEEGWEELSDEEYDDEKRTETGTDALGRNIVKKSRQGTSHDVSTTDTSQEPVGYKIRRSVPMKQSLRNRQRTQDPPPPARHTEASANRALIFRDTATSPITSLVIEATVSKKSPAHNSAVRQLRPMKQRVNYLQQQVITLRDSRAAALKSVEELKETNSHLQSDLNLANQRMRLSKQSVQNAQSSSLQSKLNNDLDKLTQEKKELEVKLTQKMEMGGSLESGHTDHEWKVLEGRLKSCSNELSRQNNVVRQLKQENEQLTDQAKVLQEKVNRAERDSSQKRTLLEDQRNRVKQALESAKADADSLEQLETRMKLLHDTNEKQKIQIDSYKKRLGAVTREKREYEERFLKLTTELEKKNKFILDSQMRKQELETSLTDMEKLATQQMKSLARESEDALETAKDKVKEIQDILQAYQRFVRNLSQEIIRRTQQVRFTLKDQELKKIATDKSNASMQRAQNLAKDILNLSQSDFDDIMSADGEHGKMESEMETERRRDKKWVKKVDRTQNSKDDFAMALMDLFLQKIEERVDLSARLQSQNTRTEPIVQIS